MLAKRQQNLEVLVTGATGFIGSHLTETLVKAGYNVTCLVRETSNLRWIKHLAVKLTYGSLEDKESLRQAVSGKDLVFHSAALINAVKRSDFWRVNTEGTTNLLSACKEAAPSLRRFVFVSSQAAAGPSRKAQPVNEEDVCQPVSCYGLSKLEAEQIVKAHSKYFPYTIIRPSAVFGPRDPELLGYFKIFARGWTLQIGFRDRQFSVIFVDDLVRAIVAAAENPRAAGQTYLIAYPEPYSWSLVGEKLQAALNRRARKLIVPVAMLYFLGSLGTLWAKIRQRPAVLNFDKAKEMAQPNWLCSTEKATKELGLQPSTPLNEALKTTFQWYKSQGWL